MISLHIRRKTCHHAGNIFALRRTVTTALIGVLTLLVACSTNSDVAGNSSDTGNARVVCTLYKQDASPAQNALVRVRSYDYLSALPTLVKTAQAQGDYFTDSEGRLVIDSVGPGDYVMEALNSESTGVVKTFFVDHGVSTVDLGTDTLRLPVSIVGTIERPIAGAAYVRIYGIERVIPVDSTTGAFEIYNLPAGSYQLNVTAIASGSVPAIVRTDSIASQQVVTLDTIHLPSLVGWSHQAAVSLNTSFDGANSSGPLVRFPLLLRLDATNFDFSQANADGSDIRLTTPYGKPAAFEIESWDAVNKKGIIWALIDTVVHFTKKQYFTLYWGNPNPIDTAIAAERVFDSANGFAAAWHFGDAGVYEDATPAQHLLSDGGTQSVEGIIGSARYFDGHDSMKTVHASDLEPSSFTVSCWFKRDGTQIGVAKLIDKGYPGYPYQSYTLELGASTAGAFQTAHIDSSYARTSTDSVIADGTWYLLSGTYDTLARMQRLYLDGTLVDSIPIVTPINYYPKENGALYLGAQKITRSPAWFKGAIDEPRIENNVRSAAWIRLCYETQKAASTAIAITTLKSVN